MKIALIAILASLSGCASLTNTGITEFSAKPFIDTATHQLLCCEVTYTGGKELATAQATLTKVGDNYQVSINETGVKAFGGTAIAAGATQTAIDAAARVAVAAALASAAPFLIPAVGAIATTGALGAVAVGAGGVVVGQKLLSPAKP